MCMSHRVKVRLERPSGARTFILSRDRLCSKARFFAMAFGGAFSEAMTGTIAFDDILLEDFSNFVHWMTTGGLPTLELTAMIRLYVLADRFDARSLRNEIMSVLSQEFSRINSSLQNSSTLDYVVENVPQTLPLYHLLANSAAQLAYHNPQLLKDFPPEFTTCVEDVLVKPYGICDNCHYDNQDSNISDCEHFFQQPSDRDGRRYRESTDRTTWWSIRSSWPVIDAEDH